MIQHACLMLGVGGWGWKISVYGHVISFNNDITVLKLDVVMVVQLSKYKIFISISLNKFYDICFIWIKLLKSPRFFVYNEFLVIYHLFNLMFFLFPEIPLHKHYVDFFYPHLQTGRVLVNRQYVRLAITLSLVSCW